MIAVKDTRVDCMLIKTYVGIACCRHERIKPEQMVCSSYSLNAFMQAYGPVVKPVRDKSEWEHVNGPVVKPPFYEKVVGRPSSKKRRKGPEENEDGTKLTKHGVTIHCGYCGNAGHNKKGCPRLKEIARAEAAQAESHTQVAQEPTEVQDQARPKRKRRRTVQEQVGMPISIPNPNRGPTIVDENGDADIPEILEVICSYTYK